MGNTIVDEPKVQTTIEVIDNVTGLNNVTDPATWTGFCGMEFRGNSTQSADKKNYSVETWTSAGADTSLSLLGLPVEEDWVFHASHFDKTWARNIMFFDAWQRMGWYASKHRFFELIIDGDYRGLYILMEKVKRDNDRVDIAKLDADDNAGDSLTGGYMIRLDWPDEPANLFNSTHNSMDGSPLILQYYYPKASNITTQQATYIQDYITSFEDALFDPSFTFGGKRYSDLIDINSFVDLFIVNEISRSADGYKLSSFLYKDKDSKGGLLKAGPIWDFDLSTYNADYCGAFEANGWTYNQTASGCDDLMLMPMWWDRFMSDTLFTNRLRCRYDQYRQSFFHTDSIHSLIDAIAVETTNSRDRDELRWNILGDNLFAQPTPIPSTFSEEYTLLKTFLTDRLNWLDANIPGNCANDVTAIQENHLSFNIYPNPVSSRVMLTANSGIKSIRIYDPIGQLVHIENGDLHQQAIVNISGFAPGMYYVKINNSATKKMMVK